MSETEKLLQELIRATDRTTRAVRAFVRFLFIQLAAISLAVVVFQLGIITQDSSECAFGICQPNGFTTTVAVLIWITGIVWSSIAGWGELELSNPESSAIRRVDTNLGNSNSNGVFGGYSKPSKTQRACSDCGVQNEAEASFCGGCGVTLA
jgi:hypothetical protein